MAKIDVNKTLVPSPLDANQTQEPTEQHAPTPLGDSFDAQSRTAQHLAERRVQGLESLIEKVRTLPKPTSPEDFSKMERRIGVLQGHVGALQESQRLAPAELPAAQLARLIEIDSLPPDEIEKIRKIILFETEAYERLTPSPLGEFYKRAGTQWVQQPSSTRSEFGGKDVLSAAVDTTRQKLVVLDERKQRELQRLHAMTYRPGDDLTPFVTATANINADHPEIRKAAEQLVAQTGDLKDRLARAGELFSKDPTLRSQGPSELRDIEAAWRDAAVLVHRHVRDEVGYGLGNSAQTASEVLRKKQAPCNGAACLSAAMLRHLGVPSTVHPQQVALPDYFGPVMQPQVMPLIKRPSVHFYASYYNPEQQRFVQFDPSDDYKLSRGVAALNTPQTRLVEFDGKNDARLRFRDVDILDDSVGPVANPDGLLRKGAPRPDLDTGFLQQYLLWLNMTKDEQQAPKYKLGEGIGEFVDWGKQMGQMLLDSVGGDALGPERQRFRQALTERIRGLPDASESVVQQQLGASWGSDAPTSTQEKFKQQWALGAQVPADIREDYLYWLQLKPTHVAMSPESAWHQFKSWALTAQIVPEKDITHDAFVALHELAQSCAPGTDAGKKRQFCKNVMTYDSCVGMRDIASKIDVGDALRDYCKFVGTYKGKLSPQLQQSYWQYLQKGTERFSDAVGSPAGFASEVVPKSQDETSERQRLQLEGDVRDYHTYITSSTAHILMNMALDFARQHGRELRWDTQLYGAFDGWLKEQSPELWQLHRKQMEQHPELVKEGIRHFLTHRLDGPPVAETVLQTFADRLKDEHFFGDRHEIEQRFAQFLDTHVWGDQERHPEFKDMFEPGTAYGDDYGALKSKFSLLTLVGTFKDYLRSQQVSSQESSAVRDAYDRFLRDVLAGGHDVPEQARARTLADEVVRRVVQTGL